MPVPGSSSRRRAAMAPSARRATPGWQRHGPMSQAAGRPASPRVRVARRAAAPLRRTAARRSVIRENHNVDRHRGSAGGSARRGRGERRTDRGAKDAGERGVPGGSSAGWTDRQDGVEPHHRGRHGNEGHYAQIVAEELGVPALDVKVVPADENRFGTGHGYNTSPSDGTPGAIVKATGKTGRRRSCSRASHSRPSPTACGGTTARSSARLTRPRPRRSPTSRSTPTAPARCRPGSRAASTPRRSTRTDGWRSPPAPTRSAPATAH